MITVSNGNTLKVFRGGDKDSHGHASDPDVVEVRKTVSSLKRRSVDEPEAPPVRIFRKLQHIPTGILAELPDRTNLTKQIRWHHLNEMSVNLTNDAGSSENSK